MELVLIIAAYPDDEVLGCGGASAVHTVEGHFVHAFIFAEGARSRTKSGGVNDIGVPAGSQAPRCQDSQRP
jgi:LmbE family N-acetylglucosaminyl deacetylase